MPLNTTLPPRRTLREPRVWFAALSDTSGSLTIHPAFAEIFASLGLTCPAAFLEMPGEVISGHADRHVVRVELPGLSRVFYLKRQHVVSWKERLRNRLARFGWSSRCEREAAMLEQLAAANLPAPRWAAFGSHGGRAFLLVAEVPGAVDLRRVLSDNALSLEQRRTLATGLGKAIAAVHNAGYRTPDLCAKHVLVNPRTLAITFIDWQTAESLPARSASKGTTMPPCLRCGLMENASRQTANNLDSLAALHASLADSLASRSERMRVLKAYFGECGAARQILSVAARHSKRRSIRDQQQVSEQRLVWLAGEAVCAIPEVAAVWPRPAIAPPFYDCAEGVSRIRIAGRDALLIRASTVAPLGRVRAWLRASPWRSPGVIIGRVLFHLHRYGVAAPRLFAFGQRFTSATRAEWFALYEAPVGVPLQEHSDRCEMIGAVQKSLKMLHDSGCVLADARAAFAVSAGRVSIADPRAVRIVRRVTDAMRRRDLRNVVRLLGVE